MSIYHIVHFGYSGTATPEQKHKVSTAFMDLAKACLLPSGMSGKEGDTYIQSIVGGSNNSPEGMSYGLEVCLERPERRTEHKYRLLLRRLALTERSCVM